MTAERLAFALLAATLGGIYLVGAATVATISPGLAAVQAVVGLGELGWAAAILLAKPNRLLLRCGAGAQLVLVVLWGLSRTVGLGGPALRVGALDAICAVDELVIAFGAWHLSAAATGRGMMLRCQLAAMLAGMTLFTLGAAHAHAAGAHGGFLGGRPGGHFFCRPL